MLIKIAARWIGDRWLLANPVAKWGAVVALGIVLGLALRAL